MEQKIAFGYIHAMRAAIRPGANIQMDWNSATMPGFNTSMENFRAAVAEAERQAGPQPISLTAARNLEFGGFGEIEYLIANSPNLRHALERAVTLDELTEPLSLNVSTQSTTFTLRHFRGPGLGDVPRHAVEFFFARLIGLARLLVDRNFAPAAVRFVHSEPETGVADYVGYFNCPVTFGAACDEILFTLAEVDRPLPKADKNLYALILRNVETRMGTRDETHPSWTRRVRLAIQWRLQSRSDTDLATIAAELGTSERNLQRYLAQEKVTYFEIADLARARFALNQLADQKESLEEIATRLGYSEVSSFHRAFQRWMHTTPDEFRSMGRKRF
jgi:AraC-like DNA-binding protein